MTQVPDVTNRTLVDAIAMLRAAGFGSHAEREESHATIEAKRVIRTEPTATTDADPSTQIVIFVSSPRSIDNVVAIPLLTGLARQDMENVLLSKGLKTGRITSSRSNTIPSGSVISTTPPEGAQVAKGSPVDVETSAGPTRSKWEHISDNLIPSVFALLGLFVVLGITFAFFFNDQVLLEKLARKDLARGLITFLIALTTVAIAIIVALSTVISAPRPDDDQRFDRSKQVLSILIGVLGTIVGFYFGSSPDGATRARMHIQIEPATVSEAYRGARPFVEGVTPPLSWSVAPNLPNGLALDDTTGMIIGTPTEAKAKAAYTFRAVDSATPPNSMEQVVSFEVVAAAAPTTQNTAQPKIEITLPTATVNVVYTPKQPVQVGLKSPVQWSITPALPSGLSLNSATGAVSGTPTAATPRKDYTFKAVDSSTPAITIEQTVPFDVK